MGITAFQDLSCLITEYTKSFSNSSLRIHLQSIRNGDDDSSKISNENVENNIGQKLICIKNPSLNLSAEGKEITTVKIHRYKKIEEFSDYENFRTLCSSTFVHGLENMKFVKISNNLWILKIVFKDRYVFPVIDMLKIFDVIIFDLLKIAKLFLKSIDLLWLPPCCFDTIHIKIQREIMLETDRNYSLNIAIYSMEGRQIGSIKNIVIRKEGHVKDDDKNDRISELVKTFLNAKIDGKINLDKSFMQLGLDSMQISELEFKIRSSFQHQKETIPMGICFQCNSPRKLIEKLEEIMTNPTDSPIQKTNLFELQKIDLKQTRGKIRHETKNPLSHAQQRIIFECKRDKNATKKFYEEIYIKIENMEPNKMFRAFRAVISRHQSLRTYFRANQQIICSAETIKIHDSNEKEIVMDIFSEVPFFFNVKGEGIRIIFHHILVDGRSISIFINELHEAYQNLENYRNLHPPAFTYVDYVIQEREFISSAYYNNSLDFWKSYLSNTGDFQRLPYDFVQNFENNDKIVEGMVFELQVPRKIFEKLKGLSQPFQNYKKFCLPKNSNFEKTDRTPLKLIAKENGTTLFVVCSTVFHILMYKTYGVKNVPIIIPVDTRQQEEFHDVIGLFVNLAIFLWKDGVDSSLNFIGALQRVEELMGKVLAHRQVPFDMVIAAVEKLKNSKNLFQIMLTYDEIANLGIEVQTPSKKYLQFEQQWYFQNFGDEKFRIRVEYDAKKFHKERIEDFTYRLLTVLKKLTRQTNVPIKNISICKEVELVEIISRQKICDFPRNSTPIETIFHQLAMVPQYKFILRDSWAQMSVQDFKTRVIKFSKILKEILFESSGEFFGVDRPIALCLPRTIDMVAIVLAIWSLGGAVVPMSNDWPKVRVQEAVSDLDNVPLISDIDLTVSSIIPYKKLVQSLNAKQISRKKFRMISLPEDLLYLTFTSGSTGKPKAVCTEAIGLCNLAMNYAHFYHLNNESVVYQIVNYAFDIFFEDLVEALTQGAKLVLAKEKIPNFKEMDTVTHSYIMPAFLSRMNRPDQLKFLSQMEVIQYGGEPIQQNWLQQALAYKICLYQLFGLTEHSIYSNFIRMKIGTGRLQLGNLYENYFMHMVDKDEQILPIKYHRGELRTGGIGVARGYYGRILNEKFYVKRNDDYRYFKTGDLVSCSPSHFSTIMSFCGRKDDQIKVRGNRVEIREIEFHISKLSKVKSVFVHYYSNGDNEFELIAYVILEEQENKESKNMLCEKIKKKLEELLPNYMLPHHVLILNEFPLNSNGKIDKIQLPLPKTGEKFDENVELIYDATNLKNNQKNFAEGHNDEQFVHVTKAQDSQKEDDKLIVKEVCKIFGHFMGEIPIEPTDNLFDKGADSLKILLAIQLIEEELGIIIELNTVFQQKTVSGVLNNYSRKQTTEYEDLRDTTNASKKIPLSYNQEHLYFLEKFNANDDDSYKIMLKLKFSNLINIKNLILSINQVIEKHEVLRTKICSNADGSEVWQEVLPSVKIFARIEKIFESNDMDEHSDDLCKFYTNPIKSSKNSNPSTYANFAVEQRNKNFDQQLIYWHAELGSIKNAVTPTDFPRTYENDRTAGFVFKSINFNSKSLKNYLQQHGCSLFHVVLAMYAKILAQKYKIPEIPIGIPYANRSAKYHDVVGYFVNTHAIKIDVTKENLIDHVKEKFWESMKNFEVPFELVVKELNPKRCLLNHPIFQNMLSYENVSISNLKTEEISIMEVLNKKAKFDQTWSVDPNFVDEGVLKLKIEFDIGLLKKSTIDELVENFSNSFLETIHNRLHDHFDMEDEVLKIWKSVLKIERISLDDNFFDLGGHSLLGATICSRIQANLKVDCPVKIIFQYQTVKEMAEILKQKYSNIERESLDNNQENLPLQTKQELMEQIKEATENKLVFDKSSLTYSKPIFEEYYRDFKYLHKVTKRLAQRFSISPSSILLSVFLECIRRRMENFDQSFNIGIENFERSGQICVVPFGVEVQTKENRFSPALIENNLHKFENFTSAYENAVDTIFGYTQFESIEDFRQHIEKLQRKCPKILLLFFIQLSGEEESDMRVYISYDKTKFYKKSIEILSTEFACVLKRMLYGQNLFPNQAHAIGKVVDFPTQMGIGTILERQSQLVLDSSMFLTRNDKYTYAKGMEKIHIFERITQDEYFKATGQILFPDTIIPVVSQNSPETIMLCLTLIKLGGAYLPIDDTNPSDRIRLIFEDAGVEFYVANHRIDNTNAIFCSMEKVLNCKENFEEINSFTKNYPEDLAYVIFTSGTTGKPKGVTIQHLGVINLIEDCTQRFFMMHSDVVYQRTNFCFDNSVLEFFAALGNGSTLFVNMQIFAPDVFIEDMKNFGVTIAMLFPGLVEAFSDDELAELKHLRYWNVGGEKLSDKLLNAAFENDVNVIQTYGPTEASVYCSGRALKPGDSPLNQGLPMQNAIISVRTPNSDPANYLGLFELHIGGVGLFRGYMNRKQQPFVSFKGDLQKYYPSGDLVRMMPNGEFLFFGRKDTQLKIRGFRVEPTEIATVITQHSQVKFAKVIFKTEISELVAYIVPKNHNFPIDKKEMRSYCQRKLPNYMVPKYIVVLREIPLNKNAKLDVSKLPDFQKDFQMSTPDTNTTNKIHSSNANISVSEPTCVLQNGLLKILSQNPNAFTAYNNQIQIKIKAEVDVERVKYSLIRLSERHAALRTIFKKTDTGFVQEVGLSKISMETIFRTNTNEILNTPLFTVQISNDDPSKILTLDLNHLISDGYSMNILAKDLLSFYYTLELPLTGSYIEFSRTFNDAYSKNFETNSKFWKSLLEKHNFENTLLIDKTQSQMFDYKCGIVDKTIKHLNKLIGQICKKFSISPLAVMLVALVKDMREAAESFETIGFFVNTLVVPFVSDISNTIEQNSTDASSDSIVANEKYKLQTMENLLVKIFDHSLITYEDLCQISRKDTLFEVMFVVDNEDVSKIENIQTFEILKTYPTSTKFPITFIVKPRRQDLEVRVEYMSSLFYTETINELLNEWCCVLKRMATGKPIFTSNTIIGEKVDFPTNMPIFDMLQKQANISPQNMAFFSHTQQQLNYEELCIKIGLLSKYLQLNFFTSTGRFLIPDDIIPIVTKSSIGTTIFCLTIMCSGAAYLPIDSQNPIERVREILKDVNADFYLADEKINEFEAFWCDLALLHKFFDVNIVDNNSLKFSKNYPEDLAYIIYTSGTTGKPKGVSIQRLGLKNMISDSTKFFFMQSSDTVYQFTNFCFDNSVLEIFMALPNGSTLFQNTDPFMSINFIKNLEEYKITHALLFPGVMETFNDEELKKLNQLRYWIVGAEKLPKKLFEKAINFGINLIQNYGPTETTAYILKKRMKKFDNPQNLGTPIQNAIVEIEFKKSKNTSKMISGEILLSSIGLFRGYIGQKERAFVFRENGQRFYASGDIGKYQLSNEILFIGRNDSQIKIRGFRVECSEIESVLSKHSNVKSAKVVFRLSKSDLVAYIIPYDHTTFDSNKIKKFCKKRLPHYMIPRFIVPLNEFPLTANSKLNEKKLPEPEEILKEDHKNFAGSAKRKGLECQAKSELLRIWIEELKVDEISDDDDFFLLGGNSLNGQRIVEKIHKIFKVRVNLNDLYENSTIEKLTKFLNIDKLTFPCNFSKQKQSLSCENTIIDRYPLSFQQEQMLYLYHVYSNNAYNLPFVQEFSLDLDPKILHESFLLLIEQNPSLRTIFPDDDYEPYQKILPVEAINFPLEIFETSTLEVRKEIYKLWDKKFDLSKNPPLRVRLFKTEKNFVTVLVLHHVISDAFSSQIIEEEISEIYKTLANGKKYHMKKKMSYAEWSLEQKSKKGLEIFEEKLKKFKQEMKTYLKNKVEIFKEINVGTVGKSLDNVLFIPTQKISFVCKNYRISPFTLFCTAISKALCIAKTKNSQIFKKAYFFLGAPIANRNIENATIIGNFLNNLLIPCTTWYDQFSKEEMIQQMHTTISKSLEFSDLPYMKILQSIREMGLNSPNLYQIYVNCRYDLETEQNLHLNQAIKQIDHFTLPIKDLIEIDIDNIGKNFKILVRIQDGLLEEIDNKKFLNNIEKFFDDQQKKSHGVTNCPKWGQFSSKKLVYASENACTHFVQIVTPWSAVQEIVKESIRLTLPIDLGPEQLKPEDNFFFLGGNSILLLKLRRILMKKFDVNLELSEILKSPTIMGLETLIKTQIFTKLNVVQQLHISKNLLEQPKILIFFHPLIGGCVSYSSLIGHLKQKDPNLWIYGIEHPETFCAYDKLEEFFNFESIEELVKFYLEFTEKEIIVTQNEIIYVGASFGGLLAYEAAVRSHENGLRSKPTKVICIDGTAKPYKNSKILKEQHVKQMNEILSGFGLITDDQNDDTIDQMIECSWKNFQLSTEYHPKSILNKPKKFDFILLKTDDDCRENDYGWRSIVSTEVCQIPGNHLNMLDKINSQTVAQIILNFFG